MPVMASANTAELVVLVDEEGRPIGSADKIGVHHESTPLHLAFSCYLFDQAGNVLLTRRALHKRTFPGIWTNSCCGHPAPDESMADAVQRRVREELGVGIADLECVLPDFRYYAVAADGVVENELCPVYRGRVEGPVRADPAEVMDYEWVPWEQACSAARLPWAISPWAVEQIPLLEAAGVGQRT
ncbi:Isopentenyl-diphosphate Delta-isomerase [Mycolicibacterium chlorophenolicum]|uniref:Isopentenyl-diphosphate Delta-isomerase n=2 Tax=Mycolicibacterium chlorophenolicum TaxID=37916 RepID=A0A0J6VRB8_9MYCO|nr:Isopentenyl-diphosphate Delta-isomerase [Mycolicibacterium chlorophenolicum]